MTDSAPRIEASDGVLDAVAQIVHFGQCFCGEWPCTEAADGAYLADAQGFVNMLGADGYRIVPATGTLTAEALAEAITLHRLAVGEGSPEAFLGHSCMGDCAEAILARTGQPLTLPNTATGATP